MKFSRIEKRDLFYAGIIISLAFAILFAGGYQALISLNSGFIVAFVIAFLTAGVGFLLHELMHKYVAQSYGLKAEFRAFYPMLWLSLLFSLFGFIIAAPGAVFIGGGFINKDKNGKISLAGPMTNIVLSIIFLLIFLVASAGGIVGESAKVGFAINSLLAAFNMIPVMPFDGVKVLAWNKVWYALTVIVAVGLFVLSWFI
ncbi:MAG: site-2 protease family protein [Nanoarchaeota archaeon]|nr:site-2 protease family protein [Nanoarchaeota archaeon]